MSATNANYLANLVRQLTGDRVLAPLVVSYCITAACNLDCCYCEDFGSRRNASAPFEPLALPDAQRLLGIIRQATDSLILTGGEPLLYPDLEALIAFAQSKLRFRNLTLLTNATLLPQHTDVLRHLDRLVISLDAVDPPVWDATIRGAPGAAQTIIGTITSITHEPTTKARVIVHCVITPETLLQAQAVVDFCVAHGILFSCSPQSVNNWPRYELLVSDEYRAFVARLIALKKSGAPILGSLPYLRQMAIFEPYPCYALLAPRVMPDGSLAFPCRPIERSGNAHGGRVNLLDAGNWRAAIRRSVELYGAPPLTCGSCYQQCYVEPSLMQAQPLAFLREMLAFPSSRRGGIHTFAPG
jgi:MoaA/NifB/PqqE/SkfB family radical SAM enzyme